MRALIVTIVTGIVCVLSVVVVPAAVLFVIGAVLYSKFGLLKFFYHDLLGWHTPDDSPQYSDGCSEHATSKYCGKDIMQDSQGNWF